MNYNEKLHEVMAFNDFAEFFARSLRFFIFK